MAANRLQDMAETCATTGNPALYCIEPESTAATTNGPASSSSQLNVVGPPPVDQEPVTPKRPDEATFDIVKATQYGASERVKELVI
jgi:hypothetical protein